MGHLEEASQNIQLALELNPPSAHAAIHSQWANALAANGNAEMSLEKHELAVTHYNCQPHMILSYARLLIKMG